MKIKPLSNTNTQNPVGLLADFLRAELRGKDELIELALAAFFARGHLLLEGPPGTGKTTLAKALAGAIDASFQRVQMTSDLLPSDIVGVLRIKPGGHDFEFREGPIFSHIVLADELNRTSPKTQSALLEAMAEATVSIDGRTYPLPDPFFVIATQNPHEFHGVYPLAESQSDRFMLHLQLGTPDKESELEIYKKGPGISREQKASGPVLKLEQVRDLQKMAAQVFVEDSVLAYVTDIVRATRAIPEISLGVSVRGGIQFLSASKALAFVRGRDFVTPADVQAIALPALAHRIWLGSGEVDYLKQSRLVERVLTQVREPR